ncbi:phosphoribosyltransferase [Lentzea sp. NBC_00516]|uniref:ComF family protein n=1 Tax=Lentzea sp. NBC_00516 TaxID=2903582 RepID=UPI002E822B93|nr:phosphoribosyltransferase family protein [Lentzea sp. NBC_00516]WUD22876.1 phosphoribosyltransferase [Lentzea sp. NBC_00516]
MSPLSRILERYLNILIAPTGRGPNSCTTCFRPTDGYPRCLQCNGHFREFGAELADDVVIISMAGKGGQLAHVLAKYKYGERPQMRKQFTDELAYVLATFLAKHHQCLGEFDIATVVPSTRQRTATHPLIDILSRRLNITRYRFAETLSTSSTNNRQLRPDEYTVLTDVGGKHVLLVDDQWTSGASLQSSAIALKRAGAARVVGVVIGRRLDARPSGTFDWNVCVICQQS